MFPRSYASLAAVVLASHCLAAEPAAKAPAKADDVAGLREAVEKLWAEVMILSGEVVQLRRAMGSSRDLPKRTGVLTFADGKSRRFTALAGARCVSVELRGINTFGRFDLNEVLPSAFEWELPEVDKDGGTTWRQRRAELSTVASISLGRRENDLSGQMLMRGHSGTIEKTRYRIYIDKGGNSISFGFYVRWADEITISQYCLSELQGATIVLDR